MGASGGSYEPTRIYVHLMFLGAPLAIGMFTLEQLVRSEGYAKQSMYGIIVGTVVTCIFDVLFIAIMGMASPVPVGRCCWRTAHPCCTTCCS